MGFAKIILPELEHELATTRRCLERVQDQHLGWKPHEKSMSVSQLISHLAEIPSWLGPTFGQSELDLAPPGGPAYVPPNHPTVADTLAEFDKNAAQAKAVLAGVQDDQMGQPWSLLFGGNVIFTLPKGAVLRTWVISHLIHHRGQLSVYLRQLGVPVPSIYGPTADEGGMG